MDDYDKALAVQEELELKKKHERLKRISRMKSKVVAAKLVDTSLDEYLKDSDTGIFTKEYMLARIQILIRYSYRTRC